MTEAAKVRIVRCPKCENLLPEVLDYSVYQCGGCGAVLSAKNNGVDLETFSEKLDEEMVGGALEEHFDRHEKIIVSEKRIADLSDDSESDAGSSISTLRRVERRRISHNSLMNKEETGADERFRSPKITPDLGDLRIFNESESLRTSGLLTDRRNGEKSEIDGFQRSQRRDAEVLTYRKECPSNLPSRSSFDYDVDGFNNVGDDRAELLRKLDEVTYQLSRSGHLIENRKEKVPLDRISFNQNHYISANQYPDSSRLPPYQNQYDGSTPFVHREEMLCNGFYPPRYHPSRVEYRDPLRSHCLRRGPYETHAPYHQHVYKSRPCMDDRRAPNDLMFYNHENSFGSQDYNHRKRISDPHSRSHNLTRWPSDVNSEADSFIRRRSTGDHLASAAEKRRPYAGGAPFLTCCNCFELLQLPKIVQTSNRKKMKCGACSTVLNFAVSDKNLVLSVEVDTRDGDVKVDDPHQSGADRARPDSFTARNNGHPQQERMTFSSVDYDNSGYDFQPINCFGEGNRSGRSTYEKDFGSNKAIVSQISMKESSETEIDLSSNEYCNTGTIFDSGEGSREGDRLKGSKVAESFFAGIMKKSFSMTNQHVEEKANVTVNGYPIQDRLIKKAEKVAGPIHPGSYWYDSRAGFWGAMGGPCLGIIPPFIEELNYPMPGHCGGGNTHVYINGRELNQMDLNLLASRGLPTESNRSYIVEISGRVLDEDTGEELEGLGKLAPTVEKSKRGFGMRDPNAVAR